MVANRTLSVARVATPQTFYHHTERTKAFNDHHFIMLADLAIWNALNYLLMKCHTFNCWVSFELVVY